MQKELLDEAVNMLPDELWWIKSDGCDVVSGLTESMRGEWSGDIDLGDGSLQKQYKNYTNRVDLVKGICQAVCGPCQRSLTVKDLSSIQLSLKEDLLFIPAGKMLGVVVI